MPSLNRINGVGGAVLCSVVFRCIAYGMLRCDAVWRSVVWCCVCVCVCVVLCVVCGVWCVVLCCIVLCCVVCGVM